MGFSWDTIRQSVRHGICWLLGCIICGIGSVLWRDRCTSRWFRMVPNFCVDLLFCGPLLWFKGGREDFGWSHGSQRGWRGLKVLVGGEMIKVGWLSDCNVAWGGTILLQGSQGHTWQVRRGSGFSRFIYPVLRRCDGECGALLVGNRCFFYRRMIPGGLSIHCWVCANPGRGRCFRDGCSKVSMQQRWIWPGCSWWVWTVQSFSRSRRV